MQGTQACKAHMHTSLTMLRLGFLIKNVTTLSLKNSINKNLGGLVRGLIMVLVLWFDDSS
jgi:hypothetical protein